MIGFNPGLAILWPLSLKDELRALHRCPSAGHDNVASDMQSSTLKLQKNVGPQSTVHSGDGLRQLWKLLFDHFCFTRSLLVHLYLPWHGKTSRRLAQRVSEHIPKWLIKMMMTHDFSPDQQNRNFRFISSQDHNGEQTQGWHPKSCPSFEPLSTNRTSNQLAFRKSLFIGLSNPLLCARRMLTQSRHLPGS